MSAGGRLILSDFDWVKHSRASRHPAHYFAEKVKRWNRKPKDRADGEVKLCSISTPASLLFNPVLDGLPRGCEDAE